MEIFLIFFFFNSFYGFLAQIRVNDEVDLLVMSLLFV